MTIDPVEQLRDALEVAGCNPRGSGRQFMARCPAHEDRDPSLSVGSGNDGRALVHCFAGCAVEDVLAELGLCLADLFPPDFNGDATIVRRTIGPPRDGPLPNREIVSTNGSASESWLAGAPMDPEATPADPLTPMPGFPFAHPGAGIVIVGPTGGGRSSLVEACLYDGTRSGLRGAYLGSEVTEAEFNARASVLAGLRGDVVTDELRSQLALVRYLNLASTITQAWQQPDLWVAGIAGAYDIVVIDPLSAVASALDLNFDQSNAEFIKFYDKLVQPLTTRGVTVVMVENVGHALEAKHRAKGASAKSDRADLTFSCALITTPPALAIKAHKIRTVRAAFQRGDEWIFHRDSQTIERRAAATTEASESFRPTVLMERVSKLVELDPGVSKRAIRTGVSGRNEYIDQALRILVAEGFVDRRDDGYHSVESFREDAEIDGACPDRAPEGVPSVPTVPQACPEACPEPDDDRAHRANTKGSWARGHVGTNRPLCHCEIPTEPSTDGRCSRCWGDLETAA